MKHVAGRRLLAVQRSQVCIQAADFVDFAEGTEERYVVPATKDNVFSPLSAIMVNASMLMYVLDIFSSASACYFLYLEGSLWWFLMTVLPLIASLIIINVFSVRWYLNDMEESKFLIGEISKVHWGLRILFHATFLGPVIRYLELFSYGLHSLEYTDPHREAYKVLVLQEERDISLLALVGSFIKSAPQLVLEVYILVQNRVHLGASAAHAQLLAVVASVVTLSASLSSYHRALRRSTPSKLNMTVMGTALQFISHCCIIGCRICALAFFASAYKHWFFAFLAFHWLLMTYWLLQQKTSFCSNESGEPRVCEEIGFNTVMAVVYVFCFMNVKDEPTKWKYTFYYLVVWVENLTLTVLWYFKASLEIHYRLPFLLGVIGSFIIGLSILAIYYRFFHPNKVSKITTFVKVLS